MQTIKCCVHKGKTPCRGTPAVLLLAPTTRGSNTSEASEFRGPSNTTHSEALARVAGTTCEYVEGMDLHECTAKNHPSNTTHPEALARTVFGTNFENVRGMDFHERSAKIRPSNATHSGAFARVVGTTCENVGGMSCGECTAFSKKDQYLQARAQHD
eukprot:450879-Pelagomonas_calceolata.AAC.4